MSDNKKQKPADAFTLTQEALAFLKTPVGLLVRRMISVSGSLYNMAVNICRDFVTREDMTVIHALSAKDAQRRHQEPKGFLDDMRFISLELIKMNNDAVKGLAEQSIDSLIKTLPLTMPSNRMLIGDLKRGTKIAIVGAPEDAHEQLLNNMPDDVAKTLVAKQDAGVVALLKSLAAESDIAVVRYFDDAVNNDVDDPGSPLKSRVGEVCRKISRVLNDNNKLVLVVFASALDDAAVDVLKESGYRVIKWNESFGPEVFYDKEDTVNRRNKLRELVEKKRSEATNAIAEANVIKEQSTRGKVIV